MPLEEEGQRGGPILAPEEIKTIFGSIPDILDVHTNIYKFTFIENCPVWLGRELVSMITSVDSTATLPH